MRNNRNIEKMKEDLDKKASEDVIGWKLLEIEEGFGLAKLVIPAGTRMVTAETYGTEGKSRSEMVVVDSIRKVDIEKSKRGEYKLSSIPQDRRVVEFYEAESINVLDEEVSKGFSPFTANIRHEKIEYVVGEEIEVDELSTNKLEYCGKGIHFFTDKSELWSFIKSYLTITERKTEDPLPFVKSNLTITKKKKKKSVQKPTQIQFCASKPKNPSASQPKNHKFQKYSP